MQPLNLYFVKFTGSYALAVLVVRAESLADAQRIAEKANCEIFTKVEVSEISVHGNPAILFEENYIE